MTKFLNGRNSVIREQDEESEDALYEENKFSDSDQECEEVQENAQRRSRRISLNEIEEFGQGRVTERFDQSAEVVNER